MSISQILYSLLIGPLETMFEIIYISAYKILENPGMAIIFMSLIMNFLLLPMYKRTDAIQAESIAKEIRMKPFISHIKKTFKGDEQFMILQTYYRQNNYKPVDALKGITPLMLEIPFFIAAYNMLSGLSMLEMVEFGPIKDLSMPDGMLVLGERTINLLPVLMTLINIASGAIYTKGAPVKTKIQLYGMATVFLILLYNSPSGLVLYWTFNNLFSLVKNLMMKLKNPRLIFGMVASALSAVSICYLLLIHPCSSKGRQIVAITVLLLLQLPLILYFAGRRQKKSGAVKTYINSKPVFIWGCVFMTLLTGVLIPSAIINSSPAEFVDVSLKMNPLLYVLEDFLLSAGTFLIWLRVFYGLSNYKIKAIMSFIVWAACCISIADYMFFGDYGTIMSTLQYENYPEFGKVLQNLVLVIALAAAALFIWYKKKAFARVSCAVLSLTVSIMAVYNIANIESVYEDEASKLGQAAQSQIIHLSTGGKNVMVLMVDRAIGIHLPFIFEEMPELEEKFQGFTYYPNTLAYGPSTNQASAALYGGYDYTPEEINKRPEDALVDKQNEALSVMPVLFSNNGYEVKVCDPSYAGYREIPDVSIYDAYPGIYACNTMGHYNDNEIPKKELIKSSGRNFFMYSIFRSAPIAVQESLYDSGLYLSANQRFPQVTEGLKKARGMNPAFMNSYNVLKKLPDLSYIENSDENTFLMLCNNTPHEPTLLQLPDYIPTEYVDNTQFDEKHQLSKGEILPMDTEVQVTHYHANAATLIQLGRWFDFMRENNVYDNTRIIIVSDHGRFLNQIKNLTLSGFDLMTFNPLLMVKDFDEREFKTDDKFMTNADVPFLATKELITSPVNPFTGHEINELPKEGEQHVIQGEWQIGAITGNCLVPYQWFSVHDNVFDINNWKDVTEELIKN